MLSKKSSCSCQKLDLSNAVEVLFLLDLYEKLKNCF